MPPINDLASSESSPRQLRVRDFYLGRQPILDRTQSLFAYELLFRNAPVGPAIIDSDLSATAAVIAHVSQLGLERVIGDSLAFVHVDAAVLQSDIFVFLPREKVVLEIVETVKASASILGRVADLASRGFKFALDDVVSATQDVQKLLPMVDYVKMDLRDMPASAVRELAPRFKRDNKLLLAEKVETRAEFQACLELDFDYFQGYYFAKPVVMSGRKLSPSQLSVMELMTLVISEADNTEVENAVKRDVPLALNLLRLVNTPAAGARRRIDSLSQAVAILGRRQLQRWLQIMLYAESAQRGHSMTPLLMLATTRGRLLELLAQRLCPHEVNVADAAFTVGIMSLMDTLFSLPMAEILSQIPVAAQVSEALLHRTGLLGQLLHLSECVERMEERHDQLLPVLRELAISTDELIEFEMAAFAWSETVTRSTA